MENSKQPAYPFKWENRQGDTEIEEGLTKRELIAAMAMQGYLAHPRHKADAIDIAHWSIEHADELLKQLNEE